MVCFREFYLLLLGNYMPKLPVAIIRLVYCLPWTLDNDDNWIRTHRLAGKILGDWCIIIFFNGFTVIAVTFVLVLTLIIMIVVPMILFLLVI